MKKVWDKKACINASKLCKTRSEFKKKYYQAWANARKYDWEECFLHMENKCKPNGYWDYANCYNAAKECNTITQFMRKYPRAYDKSRQYGWMKQYIWFVDKRELISIAKTKWTHDLVISESKKYKTRGAFQKGSVGAYEKALKKGWLEEMIWLEKRKNVYEDCVDNVYKYEFPNNVVYIGRTINPRRRDWEHRINKNGKDTVYKYSKESGCIIPTMVILRQNITLKEGIMEEEKYVLQYRRDGFTILNKAKCGSLGSISAKKWSYNNCYKEALKYCSISEFAKGNVSAYTRALNRGWLNDYTWFLPRKTHKKKNSCQ